MDKLCGEIKTYLNDESVVSILNEIYKRISNYQLFFQNKTEKQNQQNNNQQTRKLSNLDLALPLSLAS
jgi:hypothetical protein